MFRADWYLTLAGSCLQGMESYCVRAFAEALEVIPYTLAENAGLNPIQIVTELRNKHASGMKAAGINVRRSAGVGFRAKATSLPIMQAGVEAGLLLEVCWSECCKCLWSCGRGQRCLQDC